MKRLVHSLLQLRHQPGPIVTNSDLTRRFSSSKSVLQFSLDAGKHFVATAWLIFSGWTTSTVHATQTDGELLFVRRIAPLLHEKCHSCHANENVEFHGGLDLRSAGAARIGGESEIPGIVNGRPLESSIYLAITRDHSDWSPMPPKEADRLSSQQVGWIRQWIELGAPWPDSERAQQLLQDNQADWSIEDGVSVVTSGGASKEWSDRRYQTKAIWAYQPVIKPDVPSHDGTEIDAFISARLPQGVSPAPVADRIALIRRATFDLTGLPPTPEDVSAFAKDPRTTAEAFSAVIERLLDSPHYGERMAQHWLDVVRYADSSGFANDYERGNAWRYRDYVVRSFNTDKPYDQFVREQIAGDELDIDNPEMLVATGFLRMGPWELTSMEVAKIARQRFLDDVTNSVGETFLAHSLQCARCHDHKFDPIPTRDYYSLQAVFATTQLAERPAAFLPRENTAGFDEQKYLQQKRQEYITELETLDQLLLKNAEAWFAERSKDATSWKSIVADLRANSTVGKRGYADLFSSARDRMKKQNVSENDYPPKLVGLTPEQFGRERVARKGLERLKWELDRYEPIAFSVYNGRTPQVTSINAPFRIPDNPTNAGELEETCILNGGDPFSLGQRVTPGALSVLNGIHTVEFPESIVGRRTALADWIASANNPLTTRTIVNRVWQWHFGQALAGNPNNFGSTGKPPTHPELLDWLSHHFVENGWSLKSLHRVIMNSDSYRRSSIHPNPKSLVESDPNGTSYAVFHPRRLTAEELRDAMLSATGELNLQLGGIPNRPEINLEAALQPRQVMGTFAAAWTPNPLPHQRHRRSLYATKIRGLPDPLLEVFNAPPPDFSCERREASTVAPQAFSLFNGKNTHDRALALAHRAMTESGTDEGAVQRVFQLTFCRQPNADELETCLKHWQAIESLLDDVAPAHLPPPLEVRREAIEENTGEKFEFSEKLHAYHDFVSDLQPAQVSAHVRALSDLCLAIFNANEFVYVD